MKTVLSLIALLAVAAIPGNARAGLFGSNTIDDIFTVKTLDGATATLTGKPNGLKAGDPLYFHHSPFQFTVKEVKGDIVTIAVPGKSDLAVGNTLMRKINDQIKKAMDTEKRLGQALDE